MDIYTFGDITTALQNAQPGQELLFNIKNDIPFSGAVTINNAVAINMINGSGNANVALTIAGGGAFRHFATAAAAVSRCCPLALSPP